MSNKTFTNTTIALLTTIIIAIVITTNIFNGATQPPPITTQTPPPQHTTLIRDIDGDTIEVTHNNTFQTVRIAGIDAPELTQEFGPDAATYLQTLLQKESLRLEISHPDKYGRLIADVYSGQTNVGLELLSAGLAWHYTQYDQRYSYHREQLTAQHKSKGLWADEHPLPPWQYRKENQVFPKGAPHGTHTR